MIATFAELTISPMPPFSRAVNRLPGVRMIHLRHANRLVPVQAQVKEPRHLVVYRLTASDSVDILALVHDRMLVVRAARRALRTEGR